MTNGGYTHAAPIETSAGERRCCCGDALGLGAGVGGATGPSQWYLQFSQELSGSQSRFSTARTHSESEATFQDLKASLTTEVEDGGLGEPKVAPSAVGGPHWVHRGWEKRFKN